MRRGIKLAIVLLSGLGIAFLWRITERTTADLQPYMDAALRYEVEILRDEWGVPHIFGKRDVDVAFGLAYAHAEDDFVTIQNALLAAKGRLAQRYGRAAAANDYLVQLLKIPEILDREYERQISPQVRAVCEAYAEGLNYYAALHPKEAMQEVLPITGRDVVAGFLHKLPLFFRLDRTLQKMAQAVEQPQSPADLRSDWAGGDREEDGVPGSNAFAVGPKRTADGHTRLAVNSHQPWEGPVAWYEVHLHSEEGWNMYGGLFPGSPVIFHGHNAHLGWAHTVNRPDIVDVYRLRINPDNPNQYCFDGQWKQFEIGKARIGVKLWGPLRWTVSRELVWSVHGPVIRKDSLAYAVRFAGWGLVGQVEQWFRMNKATSFDEWLAAMRLQQIPMFNTVYADEQGTLYYVYNALFPNRRAGYRWRDILPGDRSQTLWSGYLAYDKLPQVLNPASGFLLNCNNTPFFTTAGQDNPHPARYDSTMGVERRMTNRALRLMALLSSDEAVSAEDFEAYKFDMAYADSSNIARLRALALDGDAPQDSLTRAALQVLARWNLAAEGENRQAALPLLAWYDLIRKDPGKTTPAELRLRLRKAAEELLQVYGSLEVEWQRVNRLVRGRVDVGLGGAPDVLRAIYGEKTGPARIQGNAGDSFILLVEWDRSGQVHSRSIHQFGSATSRPDSPHYADQAPLFARMQLKPVWFAESEIRRNLEAAYRPGEEFRRTGTDPSGGTKGRGAVR